MVRPSRNGRDRLAIARGVALGVSGSARGLAQHVEGEAIAGASLSLGLGKRLGDGLAEHELVAEDAHGLAERLADHRLAASPTRRWTALPRSLPPLAPQSITRPVSISP